MNIYYIGNKSDLANVNFHNYNFNIITPITEITIIDSYHFENQGEIMTFDYLIIKDIEKIKNIEKLEILMDDKTIITNYYLQSSLEHIFAISLNKDVTTQLQKIVNFILNIDF